MSLDDKLNRIVKRHDELAALMASPSNEPQDFAKQSKEYAELTPVVEAVRSLQESRRQLADLQAMANDGGDDPEMRDLAEQELVALREKLPMLEQQVKLLLLPRDEADERNAILEVRAGTGGEEAALFAAVLFRMYARYAALHGWRFEAMDVNETGLGGYKEATASITGRNVFARLKFESGVHRVQRVPETEASGRIHTSAATVAVLPEAEEVEIEPARLLAREGPQDRDRRRAGCRSRPGRRHRYGGSRGAGVPVTEPQLGRDQLEGRAVRDGDASRGEARSQPGRHLLRIAGDGHDDSLLDRQCRTGLSVARDRRQGSSGRSPDGGRGTSPSRPCRGRGQAPTRHDHSSRAEPHPKSETGP